jgi:outer membrane lipoprotein SlyB
MRVLLNTLLILAVTGCAVGSSLKPEVTKRDEAREPCPFVTGTVISVKDIIIEGDVETAQAAGAITGGYVGNRVAKDESELAKVLATGAGAAIGNAIGNRVGQGMSRPGVMLFVDIHNGGSGISVSQEAGDYTFTTGDKVILSGHLEKRRYSQNCPLRVFPQ